MSGAERLGVHVLAWAAIVAAVLSFLRAENISTDFKYEQTVSCPRLLAEGGEPRAPGAPQNSGALAAAAAAVAEYENRHCDRAGYGPVPPVYTGR